MYVENAVKIVDNLLLEDGKETRLRTAMKNPFPSGYWPELDILPEVLHDKMISRFQQLIGIQRCAVELGRLARYLLGGLKVIATSSSPKAGSSQRCIPHLCLFEET